MAEEVEMTPVGADELPPKAAPFTAAPAPAAPAPAAPAAPAAGPTVSTIRLKPVIRKPVIRKPPVPGAAAPAAPAATEAAKRQTSSLKSVTGPIPAQATLRKTGIIAEGILTPAQQQAAKSKTSRISLESAIGVAPTSSKGPAPLKTIRLRRPTDLNKPPAPSPFGAPKPAPTAPAQPAGVDTEATTVVTVAPTPMTPVEGGEQDPSAVTQKKTLKLTRPGGTLKRPTLGTPVGGASDGMADLGEVPELKPLDAADFGAAVPEAASSDVPGWLLAITTITSLAALLVLGAVFYFLFTEGCAPVSGENYTAFMSL